MGPIRVEVTAEIYPDEVVDQIPTDVLMKELISRAEESGTYRELFESMGLPFELREQIVAFLRQPVADYEALARWKQAVGVAS